MRFFLSLFMLLSLTLTLTLALNLTLTLTLTLSLSLAWMKWRLHFCPTHQPSEYRKSAPYYYISYRTETKWTQAAANCGYSRQQVVDITPGTNITAAEGGDFFSCKLSDTVSESSFYEHLDTLGAAPMALHPHMLMSVMLLFVGVLMAIHVWNVVLLFHQMKSASKPPSTASAMSTSTSTTPPLPTPQNHKQQLATTDAAAPHTTDVKMSVSSASSASTNTANQQKTRSKHANTTKPTKPVIPIVPTSTELFQHGGVLLCLEVPPRTCFGIDYKEWRTAGKFKGVKMIPPGSHFVYWKCVLVFVFVLCWLCFCWCVCVCVCCVFSVHISCSSTRPSPLFPHNTCIQFAERTTLFVLFC